MLRRSFLKTLLGAALCAVAGVVDPPALAPVRRLRANWTLEASPDLIELVGLDDDSVDRMSRLIADEIDAEILREIGGI